jgi:hypothetical protein
MLADGQLVTCSREEVGLIVEVNARNERINERIRVVATQQGRAGVVGRFPIFYLHAGVENTEHPTAHEVEYPEY